MKALWTSFFLCAISASAIAQEAPYGFRWGENLSEITGTGVTGQIEQDDGLAQLFVAKSLPKPADGTNFARLVVSKKFGLQRIIWVSNALSNDPSGRNGMDLFAKMKASLSEDYGVPRTDEEELIGRQPFYKCLAIDGCGSYAAIWRTAETDVRMRLIGTDEGFGWLEITYLGPYWSDVVEAMQKRPK